MSIDNEIIAQFMNGEFTTMLDSDDYFHNDEGPAIFNDSYREYWIHGNKHRIDGPAIENMSKKTSWWFINNHDVTTVIQEWSHEMNIDLDNLTEDDKVLIAMKWGQYGK